MTQDEIYKSLDEMLANPKTKNFINHLIRSYIPITNVDKVWDTPKGPFKCVLTKDKLFSAQDIFDGMQTDEYKRDFMLHMKSIFEEDAHKTSPLLKLIGDKKMGVTGKNTTTYMSYPALQIFFDWVITKSLKNDKHINWLLKDINKESFINRASDIQDAEVQKKVKKMKKEAEPKVATYTLGELDIFKELKEKFRDEDEN